jgi:hypothetical protein
MMAMITQMLSSLMTMLYGQIGANSVFTNSLKPPATAPAVAAATPAIGAATDAAKPVAAAAGTSAGGAGY